MTSQVPEIFYRTSKTYVSDMLPDDDEEDDVKECLHDVDKKWHETGMTLVGLETDDK